jgi:hypothetical protein
VLIGLVIMSAGILSLGFISAESSLWLLAISLVVVGVGLGLLSTPISNTAVGEVPINLAGTAAGVFKMSSMVGGALGVALISAFGRGFGEDEARRAAQESGLPEGEIEEIREALVGSDNFQDAIASLPGDLREQVTDAVATAFSSGVADAMVTTGVIALAATVVVALVWPRRQRSGRQSSTVDSKGGAT